MSRIHRVLGFATLGLALTFAIGCPVYVQQPPPGDPTQPVTPVPPVTTVTVIINNISAEPIHYIYMSPSTQDTWGDDLLGQSTVLNVGEQFTITGVVPGQWDIKVQDASGNCKILMQQSLTDGAYTLDVTSSDWRPPESC